MKLRVVANGESRTEATIEPSEYNAQLQVCVSALGRAIAKAQPVEKVSIEVTRETNDGDLKA